MKRKPVNISQAQALNIRALIINCQRMVEDHFDGQHDHALTIERINDILAGLGELGPLPEELAVSNE